MSPPRAGGFGASLALGLLLAACFSPELGDGTHLCGPGGLCPDGYRCALDGFCRRGGGEGIDAAGPGVNAALPGDGAQPTIDAGDTDRIDARIITEGCGDGDQDDGEECDDGNTRDADGCEGDCTLPRCDNGIRDPGELCLGGTAEYIDAGGGMVNIIAADFDGVPPLDLATANSGEDTVTFLLHAGGARTVIEPPAGTAPVRLAAADLDDEGHADLIVATQDGVTIFMNPGISEGDVRSTPLEPMLAVAAGQLGDDLLLDVVAATADGPLTVLYGNGEGALSLAGEIPIGLAIDDLVVTDLDDDGDDDIVGASGVGGTIFTFTQGDDGIFSGEAETVGGSPTSIAIARLDDDERPDLVAADTSGMILLFRNQPGGYIFTAIGLAPPPSGIAVADIDGDGIDDLATALPNIAAGAVFLGFGDAEFDSPVLPVAGDNPTSAALGDFSGDGVPDLAICNALGDQVSITVSEP